MARFLIIPWGLLLPFFSNAEDGDTIRHAISRALTVITQASVVSSESRKCFTCHHQGLPILVGLEAEKMGLQIAPDFVEGQVAHTLAHLTRGLPSYLEGRGQGGKADTAGMALWSLDMAGTEPSPVTDAVVGFLLQWNSDTPYWKPHSNRPPSEGSFFTSTFLALRGLDAFGNDQTRATIEARRKAALDWLRNRQPEETEDAVFRLRALQLLGHHLEAELAACTLLSLQRNDGGWGQLPSLPSDAYATGSALVALDDSGVIDRDDDCYRRGIAFLLESQKDDGSWHVPTRSVPIQRWYDSGFPHGEDQFISISGTCWAVLALFRG